MAKATSLTSLINSTEFIKCKCCKRKFDGVNVKLARACLCDVGKGRDKNAALCEECAAKRRDAGNSTKRVGLDRQKYVYTLSVVLADWHCTDILRGNTYNVAVNVDSRHGKAVVTFPPAGNTSGVRQTLQVIVDECGGWKKMAIQLAMPEDAATALNGRFGVTRLPNDPDTGECRFEIVEKTINGAFERIDLARELAKNPKRLKPDTIIRKFESGKADSQKRASKIR